MITRFFSTLICQNKVKPNKKVDVDTKKKQCHQGLIAHKGKGTNFMKVKQIIFPGYNVMHLN